MVISTRDRTQLFFASRPAEPFQGFRVLALIRFLAIQRFQGRCCSFQASRPDAATLMKTSRHPCGRICLVSQQHATVWIRQSSQLTALRREPGAHFDAAEDFSFPNISWMAPPEGLEGRVRRVVRLIEVELGPFQEVTYD